MSTTLPTSSMRNKEANNSLSLNMDGIFNTHMHEWCIKYGKLCTYVMNKWFILEC